LSRATFSVATASVIRTPDQRLRIFLSSTLQELAGERAAAKEAVQRIRLTPVMFETSARPHPPRDLYRAYLAQSDVFIGIYWQRYGWIAPNETVSGLEDEYILARQMPKLVYIKRADTREDRLEDLIRRIKDEDRVSYRPFSDAGELKDLIENDLAIMLTERFAATSTGSTTELTPEPTLQAPPRSNPPVERGELIGRGPQVEVVSELLRHTDTGLITLTGPGGTGKTRLAIHLAHALGPSFGDGTFFVPLADVRNASEVISAIVSTLEIPPPRATVDPAKLLLGFLRGRHALLVLDNFEQVLGAAADVAELLQGCPQLKILVTSREPLHIRGEQEVPVPPLPHGFQADGAITPAMKLFEDRAREVRPDFAIDDDNRLAVAELCRRVDALPLAIELAAARARVLSPQAMVSRIGQSLALLSDARRDLPERHRTLHATIEWSLDLLRPEEQVFFRRLGIFSGSFSEDAAAAVAADAGLDVLDGLTSLVEKSLLVRSEIRGEARFHMLETVCELARERVTQAGEERSARLRHGDWVVQFLAAEHGNLLRARTRQDAHERIALEEVGIRLALRFAAGADGDPELAWQLFIRFGVALMVSYAQTAEVLASYELVKPLPRSADPLHAALAQGVVSWARAAMSDLAAAPDLEAACGVLEDAGERDFLTSFLTAWGVLLAPGSPPRAHVILDRALMLARDAGQTTIENWALMTICYGELHVGAVDEAADHADEFASIAKRSGDEETLAYAILVGARVRLVRGDLAGARNLFADATALARARSAAWGRAMALCGLASVTLAAGDDVAARAIVEESLLFCGGVGYVGTDSLCGALALFLIKAGEQDRALTVFDAVAAGTESDTSFTATLTDPSGALRTATGEARALLGHPYPRDPASVDLDTVLRAALGDGPRGFAVDA
jgi:predicted ATPase